MRPQIFGLISAAALALAACAGSGSDTAELNSVQTVSETNPAANSAVVVEIAAKDDTDPANRRICKRTQVIGSKFNKRVCKTKAEWDHEEQVSRDVTQGMRSRGRQEAQPGG